MGSKAHTTLADEGTRKGAPTNNFGTPSEALSSGFRRLCQAPDKIVLFYRLRPCCFATRNPAEHDVAGLSGMYNGQGRVGSYRARYNSDQRARALPVAVHDRVRRHVGQRLDRKRRVEARLRREIRAADHEQVGNVPALAVLV